MSFDFIGPAIQATSDTANNIMNMEFQQEANKRERQFEREMSEEEYIRALEMWEKTNTYNSPVEQRKRLEAAGLNPALMYGKGASPGIASPAPSWNAPKSGHFGENMSFRPIGDVQGVLNAYNDLRQTNADISLKEQAARKMAAEADISTFEKMFRVWTGDLSNDFFTRNPYWKARIMEMMAEAGTARATLRSKTSEANMDEERWRLYDKEGIFLDQLTNAGKLLERKLGDGAGVILDAILGKVQNIKIK